MDAPQIEPFRAAASRDAGTAALRSNIRASFADGGLFSLMMGLGETFFSAYVLALGGSEIASGLIIAVPLMLGSILQLVTPYLVQRWGSHQRWVVVVVALQAAALLVMPVAALAGSYSVACAFAAATIYWGAGLAANPAWSTWIEGLIPRRIRTRFFARRVRISQACLLVGFLAGGFALQYGKTNDRTLELFVVVFVIAAVCRFGSAWFLTRHRDGGQTAADDRYVTVRQLVSGGTNAAGAKLLTYLFAVQVAVYISGPYFAPFMLSKMDLSYQDYALLIGLTFVGKVIALPAWGRVAHYGGARRLLWIGGLTIVPISGLWIVSRSIVFLGILQFVGGITWAAFELAVLLMFFESIPRRDRTSVLAVYNFGNSASQVTGALIGAAWLRYFGRGVDSYLWLFVASSIARAATVALLARIPQSRLASEVVDHVTPPVEPVAASAVLPTVEPVATPVVLPTVEPVAAPVVLPSVEPVALVSPPVPTVVVSAHASGLPTESPAATP